MVRIIGFPTNPGCCTCNFPSGSGIGPGTCCMESYCTRCNKNLPKTISLFVPAGAEWTDFVGPWQGTPVPELNGATVTLYLTEYSTSTRCTDPAVPCGFFPYYLSDTIESISGGCPGGTVQFALTCIHWPEETVVDAFGFVLDPGDTGWVLTLGQPLASPSNITPGPGYQIIGFNWLGIGGPTFDIMMPNPFGGGWFNIWQIAPESSWSCNNGTNTMPLIYTNACSGYPLGTPQDLVLTMPDGHFTLVTDIILVDTLYLTLLDIIGLPCSPGSYTLNRSDFCLSGPPNAGRTGGSLPVESPQFWYGFLCSDGTCDWYAVLECDMSFGYELLFVPLPAGSTACPIGSAPDNIFPATGSECDPFMAIFDYMSPPNPTIQVRDCNSNLINIAFFGAITE